MDINPDGSIRVSLAPNIYAYDGGFRTYDTIQDVWLRNLLAANPGLNPVVAAQLATNTPKSKTSTPPAPSASPAPVDPVIAAALEEAAKNRGRVYQEETASPEPGVESPIAPVLAMAGLGGLGTILGRAILDAVKTSAPAAAAGESGFVTGTHKFKKPVNKPEVPALPEPTKGYYTGNTRTPPSPTPPLRKPFNPKNMDLYTRWFNQASGPEQQSFWDSVWNAEAGRLSSTQAPKVPTAEVPPLSPTRQALLRRFAPRVLRMGGVVGSALLPLLATAIDAYASGEDPATAIAQPNLSYQDIADTLNPANSFIDMIKSFLPTDLSYQDVMNGIAAATDLTAPTGWEDY